MTDVKVAQFHLKYKGDGLSATQQRKRQRQEKERFLAACQSYPNWQNRLTEIWQYYRNPFFTLILDGAPE